MRIARIGVALAAWLVAAAAFALPPDQTRLELKNASFDPVSEAPPLAGDLLAPPPAAGTPRVYVVQLREPTTEAARRMLARHGAAPFEYVPWHAWLVRVRPAVAESLKDLDVVRAVVPLHPGFRLDGRLLEGDPSEVVRMNVFLFEVVDDPVPAVEAISAAGALIVDAESAHRLTVVAPRAAAPALARIEDVQWVQPEPVATLRNDQAVWVVQSNVNGQTTVWSHGLLGEGEIIGHIDDPLDLNNCYFRDPAHPTAGPSHRKVVVHNGSTSTSGDHGEHTAATAAGDRQPIDGSTFRNGHAYKAKLAHTNLGLISGTNLDTRLQALFDAGARVFTNSWGNDGTTAYDSWARDIDLFSRNNEDALACWAVTNLSTLKNPENAKNCLAVGATQKSPNQQNHCTGGQGPTNDGRRKPEVYAPGCSTFSANAGTSCSTQSMSGTSMASPAVAGAAALAREYFVKGYYPTGQPKAQDAFVPTGALVKAVVVNSAVDMTGVGGYPSNKEGWGRVLLENTLYFAGDPHGLFVVDVRKADGFQSAGEDRTYFVEVLSSSKPLEITLAWHDHPASLNASFTPVNDLNLEVTAPGGQVYRGNVFSGGQSTTGGSFDNKNNVERVRRNSPQVGTWTIRVRAANVPNPTQGFGLAVSGDILRCASPDVYGTPEVGSTGQPGLTRWSGVPSASVGNFAITGSGFKPNSFGVLFTGTEPKNIQKPWGTLLVGGFVTRTKLVTDGQGKVSVPVVIQPSQVGFNRYFQIVVRDPGFGGNVQSGDAVHAEFCP